MIVTGTDATVTQSNHNDAIVTNQKHTHTHMHMHTHTHTHTHTYHMQHTTYRAPHTTPCHTTQARRADHAHARAL